MIKRVKLSKTNCWLLSLSNGWLLVDTGYEQDRTEFFKSLKKQHVKPEDIKFLFLTHHHDDHSGLINDLVSINPEIRLIMHADSVELLKGGINSRDFGGVWCNKKMKKAAEFYRKVNKAWGLSFPPYVVRENDIVLTEGDCNLESIVGCKLRSVYSPGHTTDSISLLDEDMNLFCGDAASDFLRILGTSYTPPFITDLSQFYITWQKIIDSGVKKLYPAHGNPFGISKIKHNIHKLTPDKTGEFIWD